MSGDVRIGSPGLDHAGQPAVDLGELRPAAEWPAVLDAQLEQGVLREDAVGVSSRVPIRLAVPDEDDRAARPLVREDPGALAGPADEAPRMAVRERDARPLARRKGRVGRDHRHVADAERLECRRDEEPEAVADDLDGDPEVAGAVREEGKPGVVGLGGGQGPELLGRRRDEPDLPLHQAPRPGQARRRTRRRGPPTHRSRIRP